MTKGNGGGDNSIWLKEEWFPGEVKAILQNYAYYKKLVSSLAYYKKLDFRDLSKISMFHKLTYAPYRNIFILLNY